MSNNLYEGIKIFIVYVCAMALNTMVTLQLRSSLHLPASSQTPAGSWQSPRGLIVCESGQEAEPRLPLELSPAARSSSSPRWAKNHLATCWPSPARCRAWDGSDGLCSLHVAPVAVGVQSARGSLTKSDSFHLKLFIASKFQPMIYKFSAYYCSPDM